MRVPELGCKQLEAVHAPRRKDDTRPDRVEDARETRAEPGACAGDDRDPAVEPKRRQGVEHTRNLAAGRKTNLRA